MNFTVPLEFRKRDKRSGKNAPYFLLKFEDPASGDTLSLYSPFDREYQFDQLEMKKGDFYLVELGYNYNSYDKAWRVDIVDVLSPCDEDGCIVNIKEAV